MKIKYKPETLGDIDDFYTSNCIQCQKDKNFICGIVDAFLFKKVSAKDYPNALVFDTETGEAMCLEFIKK